MKLNLFSIILMIATVCSYASCSSDDPLNDDEGTGGGNTLKTGQIQMKTTPNTNKFVYFTLNAKKVTIDWGDGQIDELTPNNIRKEFKHEYTNQNLQVISIKTEQMIGFTYSIWNNGGSNGGQLAELKLGNCPDLEVLSTPLQSQLTILEFENCYKLKSIDTFKCYKLSYLNLKGCISLNKIDCYGNNLSESVLNDIFNNLPKTTGGTISCSNNPGWKICDKSIAEKKGWTVYN